MRKQYHPWMDRLIEPTFQGLSGTVKNDFGTEESTTGHVPTPRSEIGPLVDSLETFDAIVEKVVQMNNNGKWISQEVTAVVRIVLKAIAEVNKSKGVSSAEAAVLRAGEVPNE